ncbi:MAG: hypothetical protein OXG79_00555 [Chloroflexi bacterium]|nr:hypothetical protein [Chloroflexota bacterium]
MGSTYGLGIRRRPWGVTIDLGGRHSQQPVPQVELVIPRRRPMADCIGQVSGRFERAIAQYDLDRTRETCQQLRQPGHGRCHSRFGQQIEIEWPDFERGDQRAVGPQNALLPDPAHSQR